MNGQVNPSSEPVLLFGPYAFHVRQRQVLRNGQALPVGGRALDILQVLVERAGTVVSKQQMIEQVWPDSVVEEINLRVHIAALRRVLGGGRNGRRYIETVAQRGYSFIATVTPAANGAWAPGEGTAVRHNLPAVVTPLIGREEEVALLVRTFAGRRQVTLSGPAGAGKTRLACRVAERLAYQYRDGVWLVDCAGGDAVQVLEQLAALLQLQAAGRPLQPLIVEALAARQCLVLLDSAECLAQACRQWLGQWLAAAPQLAVLVTSRQPLYARGEWLVRLPGLAVPTRAQVSDFARGQACPAVQLWVSRARACQPDYRLREQDLPVVAEICRQLDGLPLAIELLAAQLDVFALSGLQAQMGNSQWLLGLGRRTAVARHRSLAAALEGCHGLLGAVGQTLLRRLAIFALDFTFEAAAQVVCCEDYGPDALRNALVLLEEHSLLAAVAGHGAPRYRLLNTVRMHALRKLQASDEYPALQLCYERYMGYTRPAYREPWPLAVLAQPWPLQAQGTAPR